MKKKFIKVGDKKFYKIGEQAYQCEFKTENCEHRIILIKHSVQSNLYTAKFSIHNFIKNVYSNYQIEIEQTSKIKALRATFKWAEEFLCNFEDKKVYQCEPKRNHSNKMTFIEAMNYSIEDLYATETRIHRINEKPINDWDDWNYEITDGHSVKGINLSGNDWVVSWEI